MLRSMRMCVRAFSYSYVERRRSESMDGRMARGRAVHQAAEQSSRRRLEQGRYFSRSQLADTTADAFEVQAFWVDWKVEAETKGDVKDGAIKMALAHHRNVAEMVVPVDVERKMTGSIPGLIADVVGVIDLVSRPLVPAMGVDGAGNVLQAPSGLQVRDLKTTFTSIEESKQGDVDQLLTYHLLMSQAGETPEELIIDYVWPGRDGNHKPIPVRPGAGAIRALVEDYRGLAAVLESGLAPRTGRGTWVCKPGKCQHWDYCMGAVGPLDL